MQNLSILLHFSDILMPLMYSHLDPLTLCGSVLQNCNSMGLLINSSGGREDRKKCLQLI